MIKESKYKNLMNKLNKLNFFYVHAFSSWYSKNQGSKQIFFEV